MLAEGWKRAAQSVVRVLSRRRERSEMFASLKGGIVPGSLRIHQMKWRRGELHADR